MTARAALAWLTTSMVALVLALALPASHLTLVTEVVACCCPDPAHCNCPDDRDHPGGPPMMRSCHRTGQVGVSPEAPAFVMPPAVPRVAVATTTIALPSLPRPHDAPPPPRPPGPS